MKVLYIKILAASFCSMQLVQGSAEGKIKIVQQDGKDTWAYQLPEGKLKTFTKKATIAFKDNPDVAIKVYKVASGPTSAQDIKLVTNGLKNYVGKTIFIPTQGDPYLLDNDAPPFDETRKVPVEKENKDGVAWTVQAKTKEGTMPWQYGQVTIKKNTNPGRGLNIPKHREDGFALYVTKPSSTTPVKSDFTQREALTLKKIKIDENGNARAVDAQ